MGADGHVLMWTYYEVAAKHKALYDRYILDDWWYLKNLKVEVVDRVLIVAYHEHGTDDLACSLHTRSWFGPRENFRHEAEAEQEAAMERVNATLNAVEPLADVEVWT